MYNDIVVPTMPGDKNGPIYFVVITSTNVGIVLGALAIVSGSPVLYSLTFASLIVSFVASTIYATNAK